MFLFYTKIIKNLVADIIFPEFCLGCKQRGEWFCVKCADTAKLEKPLDYCVVCARYSGVLGALCKNDRRNLHVTGLMSAFNFRSDAVKKAIYAIKYESAHATIKTITQKAYQVLKPALTEKKFDVIVPVPLSFWRYRERGYNQSEKIASYLSKELGVPVNLNLKKIKETESQVDLNRTDRITNLVDAFRFRGDISGRVLLIDDVFTTGSTLKSTAIALKKAGAKEVWGFTLAHETKNAK